MSMTPWGSTFRISGSRITSMSAANQQPILSPLHVFVRRLVPLLVCAAVPVQRTRNGTTRSSWPPRLRPEETTGWPNRKNALICSLRDSRKANVENGVVSADSLDFHRVTLCLSRCCGSGHQYTHVRGAEPTASANRNAGIASPQIRETGRRDHSAGRGDRCHGWKTSPPCRLEFESCLVLAGRGKRIANRS